MKASITESHSIGDSNAGKRKAVSLSQDNLVRAEYLEAGKMLPLVIRPALDGVGLLAWAVANKEFIQEELHRHGAILFRGFGACSVADFEQFIRAVAGDMLEYVERSSPRHPVSGNIYTSTDYPADQDIFLHNENSYQRTWPLKIFFMCMTPARQGGQTPIADVRNVLRRIDPAVRERFREKRVMYARNFRDGLGLSWKAVFQTEDRSVVDDYCERNGIKTSWMPGNRLRTRQYGQAIIAHPKTGEEVWFNHAAFFHISTLDPAISDVLMEALGEDELPNNTYYGDGSPIEPDALENIRNAYREEMVIFPWQCGDILMLDNMLTAHGRTAYEGDRKILVGMGEPFSRTDSER
jgi:alpha-ketoglutarate-dependent taurine dioxygenase